MRNELLDIPSSSHAEKSVLGVVLNTDSLDLAKERIERIPAAYIHDLRHREIAQAVRALVKKGIVPDTGVVLTELSLAKKLDDIGGLAYLTEVAGCGSAFAFDKHLEDLKELHSRRVILPQAQALVALAADTSKEFTEQAQALAESISTIAAAAGAKDDAPSLASRLANRQFSPLAVLVRPEPVFHIGGVGVCTAGNLTTITAAAKAGKTAFIVAMQAAAFSPSHDGDYLGVTSSNPNGFGMLHFDTEQSIYDHHELVRRTATRSGLATPPPWFRSYCLTGFSVPDLQASLRMAMEDARRDFGGIHSVFNDGAADLVVDVNDPKESNALVASLQSLAIEFECPIIGIVHLNPGSEKSRGHLGSQLERKSETNLRLEKTDGITCVWADRNRRAPITKENGPRFGWNEDAGMQLSCAAVPSAKMEAKIEKLREERDAVFGDRTALRYSEIVAGYVTAKLVKTDKSAANRYDDLKSLKLIEKSAVGLWIKK